MSPNMINETEGDETTSALVPNLRFPEFRDAPGWDIDGLGDVADFVNEKIPLERVALENYVSTENILPDYGGIAKASKLPTTGSVTRYSPNDTLVSNIRPYLKKVWVADKEGGASNDVIVIRAKQRLLPQYFSCLLRNDAFIDYVMTGAKGVKMPRGDISSMKAYPTLYPTIPEQQRIADCLGSLDELVAVQARKVEALKAHKRGLMQQLFPQEGETQPRLRFPEFRDAGGWEEHPLDGLVDIQSGATPSKANAEFWNGSVPWVTAKDMKRLFLEDSEDHITQLAVDTGARLVPAGTLLILTRGMTLLKDVPICVVRCQMSFNQDVKGLRPKDGIDGTYLAWLLTNMKQHLLAMVNIAGHGTGKLDTSELQALRSLVPSRPEQKRIADCLSGLDTLISSESTKLSALKTHKKGLMQQLFPTPAEN
jgi:type I restriction enzyme S subunit